MKTASDSKTKSASEEYPDYPLEVVRVRKVKGQWEGIEKMMDDNRNCPQILQRSQAAVSALDSLKIEILKLFLAEFLDEFVRTSNYTRLKKTGSRNCSDRS